MFQPGKSQGSEPAAARQRDEVPRVKRRRSPAMLAVAVLLIALSGLGFFWLYSSSGERVTVVVAAADVEYGQTISAEDLVSTQVAVEPGVQVVSWDERDSVIGSVASTRIPKGSLLSPGQFEDRPVPGEGKSVLGVSVKAGMWPQGQLRPGDEITLYAGQASGAGGGAGADTAQPAIEVVLVGVDEDPTTGSYTLVVEVLAEDAQQLAQYAATGTVIVILNGPG